MYSEPRPHFDRRTLLRAAGQGSAFLAAGGLLAACGSSEPAAQSSTQQGSTGAAPSGATQSGGAPAGGGTVGVKLGWIANVEYSGIFVADANGDYRKQGITVNVVPGGPNSTVVPLVTTNKVLVGIESIPENVATAVNNGQKLKIVGADLQKSPECWVSLADNPVKTPKDIEGKKLGITLAGKNTALVFMRRNGVDTDKVTLVPIQYDPAPLAAHEVDAIWGYASNQPVALELRGLKTEVMQLANFNFNRMQGVYFVTEQTLADPTARDLAKRFLAGSRAGWTAALADHTKAAQVTVDKYGKDLGLKLDEQVKELDAIAAYMTSQGTTEKGLFWMTDDLIQETIDSLGSIGIKCDKSMFTNELLG